MDKTLTVAAYETESGVWYCPTCVSLAPTGKHRLVSLAETEGRCNENADDECEECGECLTDMAIHGGKVIDPL